MDSKSIILYKVYRGSKLMEPYNFKCESGAVKNTDERSKQATTTLQAICLHSQKFLAVPSLNCFLIKILFNLLRILSVLCKETLRVKIMILV